jgi:hypothetical protein
MPASSVLISLQHPTRERRQEAWVRIRHWLTIDQGQTLLHVFDRATLGGKRDYAMSAVPLGCGLRLRNLHRLRSRISSAGKSTGCLLI